MSSARILTIDPGLYSTGWAEWTDEFKLLDVGLWEGKSEVWENKAQDIIYCLVKHLRLQNIITTVYCEYPKIFNTPGGLQIGLSGSIEKLTFLVGAIGGVCFHKGLRFKLVEVNQWKGQLPKEIVKKRIQRVLGMSKTKRFKKDIWDAVGIGLYKAGRLFQ